MQLFQRNALSLSHLIFGNVNSTVSEMLVKSTLMVLQFLKSRCRIQTQGGITVTVIIEKRSRLIHCKFHTRSIGRNLLRRHGRNQSRCGVVDHNAVGTDYSTPVARLIHRIGVHNIAAVRIQRKSAVFSSLEAPLQFLQLVIGQHLIIGSGLYPVCVVIVGLYAGKCVRGLKRHLRRFRLYFKGNRLLPFLPVAQAEGNAVGFSGKDRRLLLNFDHIRQLLCIGNITGCSLPQIIGRLYTVHATLLVIEDTARVAILLGKADSIALRCHQFGTIGPAVRSQPFYGGSDIHGLIHDVESILRGTYIITDSLNPHRCLADFYVVLIPLNNEVGVHLQIQIIVASHTCVSKVFRRQCDRLSCIILGDCVFEQGIDGVQSVLCHRPLEFAADALLVVCRRHFAVERFPEIVRRHIVCIIPPSCLCFHKRRLFTIHAVPIVGRFFYHIPFRHA